MRRLVLPLLCLALAGCLRPLRTESRLAFSQPVPINLKADLDANLRVGLRQKDNASALNEMPVEGDACAQGPKIAIIDVDGLLLNQNLTGPFSVGENPVDLFREKLDRAAADPDVCALVLRINSPGGSVTATDIMWHELQAFRERTHRPVIACLMDLGCSGAYYLATASDLIIAHPTTITGGIGVVLNLYNLRDMMGVFSIVSQSIKAGTNIDMGSLLDNLPDDTKKLLQAMADEFQQRFKTVVLQQRPAVDAGQDSTFDGRVFTARQALDRKLIDGIGYLGEALEAARQRAGQPAARVVLLHRCTDIARTPYATTPNVPLQGTFFPVSVPGAERSRLPTFLYLWQPDPTLERLAGR